MKVQFMGVIKTLFSLDIKSFQITNIIPKKSISMQLLESNCFSKKLLFSKVEINSIFFCCCYFPEVNGIVMIIGLLNCMFREDFYCLAYLMTTFVFPEKVGSVIVVNKIINLCTYLSLKTFYCPRETDRCSNSYSFGKQGRRTNSKKRQNFAIHYLFSSLYQHLVFHKF